MLSILIPVYNTDINNLISELTRQKQEISQEIEIIVWDDASKKTLKNKNKTSCHANKVLFYESEKNLGREQTRYKLALKASFETLLFIDSDVLLDSSHFISKYLNETHTTFKATFGGISYNKSILKPLNSLRYYYGLKYEQISVNKRKLTPYKAVVSANFLIDKSIFLSLNTSLIENKYGYDILFAGLLKSNAIKINHIDNTVSHMGLENNTTFLKKSEEALCIYYKLLKSKQINKHENQILKLYSLIDSWKFTAFFNFIFKKLKPLLRKNLIKENPSIIIFQLYRFLFLCTLKFNKH